MDTYSASKIIYDPNNNSTNYSDKFEPRIFIAVDWAGSNKKILDVGCYDGRYSKLFKKNNNIVYGIDANKKAVLMAKKNGVHAEVCNAESKFPFENGFFDVIHAGEIIEHLYDTDSFISECRRVLKKDGILIITTPNTLSLPRRILYLCGIGRFFEASNSFSTEKRAVGHIRFFTKKLLIDYVESKKFIKLEFTSDYVNILPNYRSNLFAKLYPTFGRNLIVRFKRK